MQIIAVFVLIASVSILSVVSQTTTPISPNGPGIAGAGLTGTGTVTDTDASNCGQVEFDIFNIGATNQPLRDLFQYITTGNADSGVNFVNPYPYVLQLPTAAFPGGVQLEIILSPQQGSFIGPTGVAGPFNASIDTISVNLNNQYTLTHIFNNTGNNFSFTATSFPTIGSNFILSNFSVQIVQAFPTQDGLITNSTCATTYVLEIAGVKGDPQFVGLRGQSYQIHGIDGAVYNLISDKEFQLNSRFGFLTGPRPCPRMPSGGRSTACWSHPGSYVVELGLIVDGGRVFIKAGTAMTGFDVVMVDDKPIKVNDHTNVVAYNSSHELTLRFGGWTMEVENSDSFVNIRSIRVDRGTMSKLSSHGLIGQTWSGKKYSGAISAIEGEVEDYLIEENTVFGKAFLYNKYTL